MKLTKAIESLQKMLDGTQPTSISDRRLAIKLLISAGKRIQRLRDLDYPDALGTLPGETEEEAT